MLCRVLAGDITSQNVMLRCLRRVLQGKIDRLVGQIKEIEDAEQAKKNRMMSRKGAERGTSLMAVPFSMVHQVSGSTHWHNPPCAAPMPM